jgi:hypothetical protein
LQSALFQQIIQLLPMSLAVPSSITDSCQALHLF